MEHSNGARHWPIAREGLPFILPLGAAGGILTALSPWGAFALLPALFTAWFFRDPRRVPPQGDGLVLSPADGRVVLIQPMYEPEFLRRNCTRVSIFMSVLSVHVNRMPLPGQVKNVRYSEGKFHVATKPAASQQNEQNAIHIHGESGEEILVVQIAGILARRIVCDVRPGHILNPGDRLGLIRFGSRVDVYLPEDYDLRVKVGDRVRTARTVVAVRRNAGGTPSPSPS